MPTKKTTLLRDGLDPVDSRILDMLQHDARVTTKEIADKLGLTVTPVAVRIKKLEKAGYILRYVAILDREKIHRGLIAFTGIQLGAHSQAALRGFEKSVARIPEVVECYRLTGKLDFLAKIAVRDMSEYNSFLIDSCRRYRMSSLWRRTSCYRILKRIRLIHCGRWVQAAGVIDP